MFRGVRDEFGLPYGSECRVLGLAMRIEDVKKEKYGACWIIEKKKVELGELPHILVLHDQGC